VSVIHKISENTPLTTDLANSFSFIRFRLDSLFLLKL
jgi:hypothetical protein